MPDFTIRPATTADIPALQQLIKLSVRGLQQQDYSPTQIEASIGSAFGVDRQLIADRTYFVAAPTTDPATLLACGGWSYRTTMCGSDALCGADTNFARDNTTLSPATDYAKIRAIFVHPAWARRGLGSLILAHCEAAAHAAGFNRFEMGSTLTGVPLYTNGEPLEIVIMDKSL
jgi:GNAT superfamily N-acetyltransferase